MRKTDPGVPEDCPVFSFHKAFSTDDEREDIVQGCTSATIGCIDCKKILIKNLNLFLDPFRERRNHFKDQDLEDILEDGRKKVRQIVARTLQNVKEMMKI
jgi:tryptophanyl-tRNA synthetase